MMKLFSDDPRKIGALNFITLLDIKLTEGVLFIHIV